MEMNVLQPGESRGTIQMIGQFWERKDFILFREQVDGLLDKGVSQIVVDLSRVSFISSQGLGLLVQVFSEVKKHNGDLLLFKPKGCVNEVIEISGLDMSMKIIYSEKELEQYSSLKE